MFTIITSENLPVTAVIGIVSPIGEENKYIIVRNKRGWDLPGGHLESGESARDAIVREVKEETDCLARSVYKICRIQSSNRKNDCMEIMRVFVEYSSMTPTEEIIEQKVVNEYELLSLYFGDNDFLSQLLKLSKGKKEY